MDAYKIERLLHLLGCQRIRYGGRWVTATCPFASWRHAKGSDKRPSFGVIPSNGRSHFNCHAGGARGDLHTLVWRIWRMKGHVNREALMLVTKESPSIEDLERIEEAAAAPADVKQRLERATYWGTHEPAKKLDINALEYPVLEESDLDGLRELPPAALAYLTGPKRGLYPHTIELWELGWQPQRRRVVLPVRDWEGRLVGLTGRAIDEDNNPKFLHSTGFKRDYFVFGEHLVERGEPGYLVEGHFDAIYLRQMGYPNACAVMGSHLSIVQVEKLVTMMPDITIVPDGDQAGGEAAEKWEYALKSTGKVKVRVVSVEEGRDPDEYDQEELDELLAC